MKIECKEYWFNNGMVAYFVPLTFKSFKLGLTLGKENCIYLGFICFGIDFY
jgi:hypothetical protein